MPTYMKKICLLGEPEVGKTSLMKQFVEGKFDDKYTSTIGTNVKKKQIIFTPEELQAPAPEQEQQIQSSAPPYQQSPPATQYPYQQPPQPAAFQQPAQPSQPYYQQPAQPQPAQPAQTEKPSRWERFKNFFKRKKNAQAQPVQPLPQTVPQPAQPDCYIIQAQQPAPYHQEPLYQSPAFEQPQYQQSAQPESQVPEWPEPVTLNLAIWDILGQKKETALQKSFYQGAGGALLVCDCSRTETAQKVPQWLDNLYAVTGQIPIVLLGNKYDLVEGTDTVAYLEQLLSELGNRYDAPWHLTSAKTGHNVEESFRELGKRMIGG